MVFCVCCFCFLFSLSCLSRGAPGRHGNIENSLKTIGFSNEFAWVAFLRQVQREQISEHRRTHKLQEKHVQKQRPPRVEKSFQNHRFWPPKWLQNRSNIAPGGLSEAAGAPRRTQEQQTATKKTPRASQERPKSARKRFSRFSWPRGGPNSWKTRVALQSWRPGFWRGRPPGTTFSRGGCVDFRVFWGSLKKWPPLKLKQALANLN